MRTWACERCTFINENVHAPTCEICGSFRGQHVSDANEPQQQPQQPQQPDTTNTNNTTTNNNNNNDDDIEILEEFGDDHDNNFNPNDFASNLANNIAQAMMGGQNPFGQQQNQQQQQQQQQQHQQQHQHQHTGGNAHPFEFQDLINQATNYATQQAQAHANTTQQAHEHANQSSNHTHTHTNSNSNSSSSSHGPHVFTHNSNSGPHVFTHNSNSSSSGPQVFTHTFTTTSSTTTDSASSNPETAAKRTAFIKSLKESCLDKQDLDDGNADCAICMQDQHVGDLAIKLSCYHAFHKRCLMPWLEKNGVCPVCRLDLLSNTSSTEKEAMDRKAHAQRKAEQRRAHEQELLRRRAELFGDDSNKDKDKKDKIEEVD